VLNKGICEISLSEVAGTGGEQQQAPEGEVPTEFPTVGSLDVPPDPFWGFSQPAIGEGGWAEWFKPCFVFRARRPCGFGSAFSTDIKPKGDLMSRGEIIWTAYAIMCAFVFWRFVLPGIKFWLGAPRVELRQPPGPRGGGCFWQAMVSYDRWGQPYAKAHDGKTIKLYEDGRTGDFRLYGTEWRHASGPQIVFPPPDREGVTPFYDRV
jgi:hypothetical protein